MLPSDQGVDGKAVPEVMCPRVDGLGAHAERGGDLPEGLAHAAAIEPGAHGGDEERPRAGPRAEAVALGGVARQGFCDRGVQRDQPGAVELRVADRNDPGLQVDVVAVEADRLADPHAAGSEQPKQRLVGRRPNSRAQRSGALQQTTDVALRPQERRRPVPAGGEHARRRDLRRRVERPQVAGKPASDGRQALRPVVGLGMCWQPCPGDRELTGHRRHPAASR